MNYDLFKDYFDLVVPSALAKNYVKQKNEKKKNVLVELIKNRLSDLKYEIEKMSEDEKKKKIEKPDKTMKVVKEIFEFNKRIQIKQGLGLKILRPNQMLSRLPISLA